MQQKVARFWRPFALYGRSKHRRQVAFQFDFQGALVGRHDDGVDQAPERLSGFRAGFWMLQRLRQRRDLLAVQRGHLGMEKRRRFVGGLELSLQLFATGIQRLDLSLAFVDRYLVVQQQIQQFLDADADPLDLALC